MSCPFGEDLKKCLARERGSATHSYGGRVGGNPSQRPRIRTGAHQTKPSAGESIGHPVRRTFGRTAANTNSDQDSGARPNVRLVAKW